MKLPRAGELVAGRFLVLAGDKTEGARSAEDAVLDLGELWVRGRDVETGAAVLLAPRLSLHAWARDIEREAMARRVAAARVPGVVEILHAGPGVAFAAPPPGVAHTGFTIAEAAAVAVLVCEATALVHAAGVGELCFDPFHLRIVGEAGQHEIRWLVPGNDITSAAADAVAQKHAIPRKSPLALARRKAPPPDDPLVRRHGFQILDLFAWLCSARVLAPSDDPSLAEIRAMFAAPRTRLPPDVATLARCFLSIAPPSPALAARVEALPRVSEVRLSFPDWDLAIADGEAELRGALASDRPWVAVPLAAAYHQRASRAWAQGDRAAALRDAERAVALDGARVSHRTTLALALVAAGRHGDAARVLDRAPVDREGFESAEDEARFRAARGVAALKAGEPAAAARHLRAAVSAAVSPAASGAPAALYAHLLGDALEQTGDLAGASAAHDTAATLEPGEARYRWALVRTLRALGRDGEARANAEAIVARVPEDAAHRARFERLFGGT